MLHTHNALICTTNLCCLRSSLCVCLFVGWCVGTDYECKINEWAWCKQVSKKWACKYNYKPKDTLCSPKKGSCSQPAYCK